MDEYILLTSIGGLEPGALKAVSLDDHEMLVARVEDEYFIADPSLPS